MALRFDRLKFFQETAVMQINIRDVDNVAVVELTGELDSNSAPQVQDTVLPLAEQDRRIILDMSRTTFMSSAGLRILLLLYRQLSGAHGRVVLVGLSEQIKDTMSITGFLNFFKYFDTLPQGMSAVQQ